MVPYVAALAVAAALTGAAVLAGWLRRRLRIVAVVGYSMWPALSPGDQLLVRLVPLCRVEVGDIVVLADPSGSRNGTGGDHWLVKRAVAGPGDPVPASVAPALGVRPGSPAIDGAFIAIGDNRECSYDSRTFGYVGADQLLGVVLRPIRAGSRRRPAIRVARATE